MSKAFALPNPGALGSSFLIHIDPERDAPTKSGNAASRPAPIVVLDRSGSMDQFFTELLTHSIPRALLDCGYAPDQVVHIVTFDSVTEVLDWTIKEMQRASSYRDRGCTCIAPAFKSVHTFLDENPNQAYRLIVISDGEVNDMNTLLVHSEKIRSEKSRPAPVSVGLVRVRTSSGGSPDTRALTAFGCFGVDSRMETTEFRPSSASMTASIAKVCPQLITYEAACSNIRILPGQEAQPKVTISGPTWVLSDSNRLVLDGKSVDLDAHPVTETQIEGFLEAVENRIRQLMVLDTTNSKSELDNLFQWLSNLSFPEDRVDGVRCRAKAVAREAVKRRKGILGSILELRNHARVSQLNSAQQAEFIRGVGTGRAARYLARRAETIAATNTDGLSDEERVQKELRSLRSALSKLDQTPDPEEPISFYSQDSCMGAVRDLLSLSDEEIDALSLVDALQIVGLGGFPAAVKPNPYPSPWALKVNKVATGSSVWLGTHDLYAAETQAKTKSQGAHLHAPGHSWEVNAVVPIRCQRGVAWALLHEHAPTLCNLSVAIGVRGVMTPMPFDETALVAAAAVCALREGNTTGFNALRKNIRLGFNADILKKLLQDGTDPRGQLVGDLDIVSSLQPMTWVMAGELTPSKELYVASVGLTLRHSAKNAEDSRSTQEQKLLKLDSHSPVVGEPFTEDPSAPEMQDELPELDTEMLSKWASHADEDLVFGITLSPEEDAALMVQAYRSPSVASFVNKETRECNHPWIRNPNEAKQYLQLVSLQIRLDKFDAAIKGKREAERRIRLQQLIAELVATPTVAEFVTLLTKERGADFPVIDSRSSEGYTQLLGSLQGSYGVGVQSGKIAVLILGRTLDDLDTPVWNKGNILRERFGLWECHFSPQQWLAIMDFKRSNFRHAYRLSGEPNRYGHSNSLPSWWARGYANPKEFFDADRAGFDEYVTDRTRVYKEKFKRTVLPSWFADIKKFEKS